MFVTGIVSAQLDQYKNKLVVPRSSVEWTGKRSVVYVKQANSEDFIFKIREIELGPLLGNSYVVMNGLTDGEEIVTQGTFSVDAAAQLEGKPSMMNTAEGEPKSKPEVKMQDKPLTENLKFTVSGNCEMCKARIEKAALSVKGVIKAIWTVKTKILKVDYNEDLENPDSVYKAIADAGHDTKKYKADNSIYDALPSCCKYR